MKLNPASAANANMLAGFCVLSASMPGVFVCCNFMRKHIMNGDEVLSEPPSGAGATLTIKYQFTRK